VGHGAALERGELLFQREARGVFVRAYSYPPRGLPNASWTYVEVWKIGTVTAPVAGSGSCPAWMHVVAKPGLRALSVIGERL